MLSTSDPAFVPILLPRDREAYAAGGQWRATIIAATYGMNPRTRPLCDLARDRSETLIVDPKTAQYQFEGYMSMEDARAVPYSPGRSTLGTLWQPGDFDQPRARARLTDEVFALQERLGADLLLAPYFLVPHPDHPWLAIAADCVREALDREAPAPVGAVVCVELDALLHGGVQRVAAAWSGIRPALMLVIVVDHDEREASPDEMRAVMALLESLQESGAPVAPAYAGRLGLAATTMGAAGYAAGALELESHPKRYFREGLVNLPSNSYYLPGAMVRLPVREAAAVSAVRPDALGRDSADPGPARLVKRRRLKRALEAKRRELRQIHRAPEPLLQLRERLDSALELCGDARQRLHAQNSPEAPTAGAYHYLEVVREMCGGPPASIPADAGI